MVLLIYSYIVNFKDIFGEIRRYITTQISTYCNIQEQIMFVVKWFVGTILKFIYQVIVHIGLNTFAVLLHGVYMKL